MISMKGVLAVLFVGIIVFGFVYRQAKRDGLA
jgi:hypothetical protein